MERGEGEGGADRRQCAEMLEATLRMGPSACGSDRGLLGE